MSALAPKLVGGTLAGLFFSLFAIPSVITAGVLAYQMWFWAESGSWVDGQCWIDRVDLIVENGEGTTYKNVAYYHYDFRGRTYDNDRVAFIRGGSSDGEFHSARHLELESRKSSGRPLACLINSVTPSESVLYRDFPLAVVVILSIFSVVFGTIGFGGLAMMFRART